MISVLKNGYGTYSICAIKDKKLHIKSKAIYLFLCAYKNIDNIATVKRETIMNYLAIGSKDTYYKYLKPLVDNGYVTITPLKVEGKFYNNQFKINAHIENKDIFEYYGIIPKEFMNDKDVPIEAKGVYGYLGCYRKNSSNNVVYADLSQIKSHLGIASDTRISKSIKSLVDKGYIEKEQYINKNKYSSNSYKFLGFTDNIPIKESKLSEEKIKKSVQNEIEKRDARNKKYKQVIKNESKLKREIKQYESKLKSNLKYDYLKKQNEKLQKATRTTKNIDEVKIFARMMKIDEQLYDFTNDVINIIIRAIFSKKDTIKLSNIEYPKFIIKRMFLRLELQHIEEILRRYKKAVQSTNIKNPSAYIETVLLSVCFDYGLVKIINEV